MKRLIGALLMAATLPAVACTSAVVVRPPRASAVWVAGHYERHAFHRVWVPGHWRY